MVIPSFRIRAFAPGLAGLLFFGSSLIAQAVAGPQTAAPPPSGSQPAPGTPTAPAPGTPTAPAGDKAGIAPSTAPAPGAPGAATRPAGAASSATEKRLYRPPAPPAEFSPPVIHIEQPEFNWGKT